MTTEEDGVTVGSSPNEFGKDVLGTWPQGTLTDLASLSTESNERMFAVALPDLQIAGLQSGHLGDPCPGVVEEQQQGVFGSTSKRLPVRACARYVMMIGRNERTGLNHVSFEVQDIDDLWSGHIEPTVQLHAMTSTL